jgi:hypothetical protein
MSTREQSPTRVILEVLAISDHEWRVCDGRIPASDATRMLGFIDKTGNSYELIRLQHGQQSERFSSLDAALDALQPLITKELAP